MSKINNVSLPVKEKKILDSLFSDYAYNSFYTDKKLKDMRLKNYDSTNKGNEDNEKIC